MSETSVGAVTPELVLVDPELARAQQQTTEGKAAMSSTEPSNGTFFVDPAQPTPAPTPTEASPALVPAREPAPLAAPAPEASAPEAPAAAPAPPPAATHSHISPTTTPMVDVPLGTLIFRAGLLAEEQLEDALQEGMRTGKRLGEVLLERGWLHERDLGRMLAGQKGLPFVEIHSSDAELAALEALPMDKARMQTALPLRFEDGQLVVAVADPSNELVLENLRRAIGSEPKLVVAAHGNLVRAIEEAYGNPGPDTAETDPVEPAAAEAAPVAPAVTEPTAVEPPVTPVQAVVEPEPTHLAPPPAPVVTPLPTVLPPAEERSTEPTEPSLQPLITAPAAQVVEQVVETPGPVAEPLAVEPVHEAPAPLLEPPAVEHEPTTPVEHEPTTPVEAIPPLLQPSEPVAGTPAPMPLHTPAETPAPQLAPEPVQPAPLAPEPLIEAPIEAAPPLLAPPEEPTAPEPPLPAAVQPDPASSALHIVLVRLREGDVLEVGTFNTAAEASARAQEVVRQIATAEGEAAWPFFAERYLRPDSIVSIDLIEESADKWLGSAARTRWANPS